MTMIPVNVPMPKDLERVYRKEAKRRTRETKMYVSRADVMRDCLANYAEKIIEQWQVTLGEKEQPVSR
jgi:hypothetical protein